MMHYGYFDTTRKGNHTATLIPTVVCGQRSLPSEICAQNDSSPFEKRRLRQISAYNVSTVRDSEKIVQLWRILCRPRAFQRAMDGVRTLPYYKFRKGGSKSDFFVFFE